MESVFEFLFKYRPILFREGDFALGASWPVTVMVLVGGVAGGIALYSYTSPRGRADRGDRVLLTALRAGALAILVFCLVRPTLVLTSTVPQRNFVGVLVDDSRSMSLPDRDGTPRSHFVDEAFGEEEGELLAALRDRFAVRLFRFSSDTERMDGLSAMTYDGTATDLASALDRARDELSSVPLSGLVVVSDGANNAERPLAEALVPLQAASVPVFTVGVGEETLAPDIQVGRVDVPRRVLQGNVLAVDVLISQSGYARRTIPVIAEDERRILTREDVRLEGGDTPTIARLRFELEGAGPHRIRFRVPPQEGESVEQNNERTVLVEVLEATEKILYFEGEPRDEVGFLRRAVADDQNLQVVVLVRSAENKFQRLSVDDGEELASGFPKTREELFRYRALILGSVEASFFTHEQLSMIADFVSRRGGGLIALGGRRALAEGGYGGTALAEVLPVVLEPPVDPQRAVTTVRIRPTAAGRDHPVTRLGPTGGEDQADDGMDVGADPEPNGSGRPAAAGGGLPNGFSIGWDSLPPLIALNPVREVKPGAVTLLEGVTPEGETRVALAHHRYGRGRAIALPVENTWTWQMHADVPLEDLSHETFWKQLLRWTVDGVPDRVAVQPERERVEVREPVRVVGHVRDSAYVEVNDASLTATVRDPTGAETTLPMEWVVERDGEYSGTFRPEVEGRWMVSIEAHQGDVLAGTDAAWIDVGPSDAEYFDAGQHRAVLERLARETGGRYYDAESAASLPEDIQFTGSGVTLTEQRDLWDMPILFLMLVGLVGAEWAIRRRRGLV